MTSSSHSISHAAFGTGVAVGSRGGAPGSGVAVAVGKGVAVGSLPHAAAVSSSANAPTIRNGVRLKRSMFLKPSGGLLR